MSTIRVCCVSDLHGHLPELPSHELLIVAGDICPATSHHPKHQRAWLQESFLPWLDRQSPHRVVVWGNHDLIGEDWPELVPHDLRRWILTDRGVVLHGLKIWGSPWQLRFYDWAFNLSETQLAAKYAAIPDDVDIIATHGPPFGAGDLCVDGRRVGSPSLTEAIRRIKPKLVVTGHIHHSHGTHDLFGVPVVNAAICDEGYRPTGKPIVVDIEVPS
jgi:Icc-related predicted phosphoesterase